MRQCFPIIVQTLENVSHGVYYNSFVASFWNTILAVNSVLLVGASVFLVYSFGMMIIAFEWKRFLLALTIFVVLIGTEMVFNALCHD